MDVSYLRAVRKRVGVARRIDAAQHRQRKVKKSNDWFVQSAKAMEIDLDDDLYPEHPHM